MVPCEWQALHRSVHSPIHASGGRTQMELCVPVVVRDPGVGDPWYTILLQAFANLEPVCFTMFGLYWGFLTCIFVSHEDNEMFSDSRFSHHLSHPDMIDTKAFL